MAIYYSDTTAEEESYPDVFICCLFLSETFSWFLQHIVSQWLVLFSVVLCFGQHPGLAAAKGQMVAGAVETLVARWGLPCHAIKASRASWSLTPDCAALKSSFCEEEGRFVQFFTALYRPVRLSELYDKFVKWPGALFRGLYLLVREKLGVGRRKFFPFWNVSCTWEGLGNYCFYLMRARN